MAEKVHIPFNKDFMTLRDMTRAVETFEIIINRWHSCNERFVKGEYDLADFFWEVDQQIHYYSTRLHNE
jgi:hypothetical protein